MKKDIDGINDEYEEDEDLPAPLLDLSDDTPFVGTLDTPFEDALDLSDGEFDLFEKKPTVEDTNDESVDITHGKFDVFALSKREDIETEESFDIISKEENSERFPLTSVSESDRRNKQGESGDFIHKKTPVKPNSKKRGGIITAAITCVILIVFLAWTVFGIAYTNKYNKYIYKEFLNGIDVEFINPDFAFFITVDGKTLPVIKSETPKHFTTFNGKFFSPGTLTANGTAVTGSSRLLPSFTPSLVGTTVVIENGLQKTEYEIYSIGEYSLQPPSEELVIYIEDKSSSTGYTALYAK